MKFFTGSPMYQKGLLLLLLFSVLLITNISYSQSVTGESFYIKLRKISQLEEQNSAPIKNNSGFRVKSSSYSNALLNQSNFKGYKTQKNKKFAIDNNGSFVTNHESHFNRNTPQMILTNSLAVIEYQATELFAFRKKELMYIGAISGITLGLIALDAKLDKIVRHTMDSTGTFDDITDFITDFGAENSLYTVAVFAGLSYVTKSKKGIQTSLYAFEAMLNSGLWIRLGKLLAGRERPEASYEYSKHPSGIWRGPIHQIINKEKRSVASYDAFPSGHTATIFSVATVFAEQYKDIPFVPIFSYTFAGIVGISRMLEHAHWASDVFLGACIGYFCGKTTVEFYRQKEHYSNKKVKFSFMPSVTPQNYGADFVMNF
ncbi:MAG: phosphatase PAP2 family protein [Ignavibacteria bacterium]|jgi:membrane-associated phospholipid phosphatase